MGVELMKASVADKYTEFTTKFEGKLPFMYLDVKNLVTTGIGNLIDPIGSALSLPWKHRDGSRASQSEIASAWNAVKNRKDLSQKGGGVYAGVTDLRLDNDGIKEVVNRKLLSNEEILRKRFRSYDSWPADAQLGVLSMAWAAGANFKSPKFEEAANGLLPDFTAMARESKFNAKGNPGLVPRNEANQLLFTNAARIMHLGLDFESLFWPLEITDEMKKDAIIAAKGLGGITVVAGVGILGYLAFKNYGA
jgi:GH24 family phage-related lysozyme (muramidase)